MRVAYLGSHGYHLDSGYTLNSNTFQSSAGWQLLLSPGVHRIRPDYNAINEIAYDFNSFYDGLTATVGQRVHHGLSYEASYAFSRATDDTSLENSSRTHLTAEMRPPDGRRNTYHGLSGLDMRHRFIGSVTYDLPAFASSAGLVGRVLSGWEMNSIFSIQAGTPITPWIGFDQANTRTSNAGESQRPSFASGFSGAVPICPCMTPASLGGGVRKAPQRYFDPTVMVLPTVGAYGNMGRNVIIGPGLINVDLALVKSTQISERFTLQFRAEAYNLFNNVNWIQPSTSSFQSNGAYSGNVGAITNTSTTGRQLQLALKLSF